MVRLTGLEPVTSAMSRQRSNQLSYRRFSACSLFSVLLRDSGAHVIQEVWGLQAFFLQAGGKGRSGCIGSVQILFDGRQLGYGL